MKLEINNRKREVRKNMETKQHGTKKPVAQQIKKETKKYLETNNSENTTIQNLWNAAKAVLRGKFIVLQAFLKKQKFQTS